MAVVSFLVQVAVLNIYIVGSTSSTVAELWALKDGFTMAKQMGIENISIEMDAKFIVQLVSTPSMINLMLKPLLSECRDLIQTFLNYTTPIFIASYPVEALM